jgi:caffeoyl-CoA O-methyltransferase
MSNRTLNLNKELYQYVLTHGVNEPEILQALRQTTADHPMARMQISPEQGQFMGLLLKLMMAKRVIEIGVFTGYSTLAMALALPRDAQIIACDINQEWVDIGIPFWQQAGITHKINLQLQPANDTLAELILNGASQTFDFAFIDADKENYDSYYEHCLQLIRPGGLIVLDNTLWSGAVADPSRQDPETVALRTLNDKMAGDTRVESVLLPLSDGLTLARKC